MEPPMGLLTVCWLLTVGPSWLQFSVTGHPDTALLFMPFTKHLFGTYLNARLCSKYFTSNISFTTLVLTGV